LLLDALAGETPNGSIYVDAPLLLRESTTTPRGSSVTVGVPKE
jgi:hypothetical protein